MLVPQSDSDVDRSAGQAPAHLKGRDPPENPNQPMLEAGAMREHVVGVTVLEELHCTTVSIMVKCREHAADDATLLCLQPSERRLFI